MIYRIKDIRTDIAKIYDKGITKGELPGFKSLNDYYSIKLGATTYIVGSPASGKTEFALEILMNLSEKFHWKHAIFSPETGTKEEIAAELISKKLRKPFYKNYPNHLTEKERFDAEAWLDNHFFIVDTAEKDLTIEEFYKMVDDFENEQGITIQTTTGDPFNEFKHNFGNDEGRQDLYIERILGLSRKNAKAKNRHNFIITHCRDQQAIFDKDTKTYYHLPPTARDYAGGQAWFRKGLAMICVYRPPAGMSNEHGMPNKENEVHILIQKAKPKGIGKVGKVILYFDWHRNRYYEDLNGRQTYAWNTDFEGNEFRELTPIKNLVNYYEKETEADVPF